LESKITIQKIKQALILLSNHLPLEQITVQQIIDVSHVSRSTFYKYFENIPFLWHCITHDLLNSMSHPNMPIKLTTNLDATPITVIDLASITDMQRHSYLNNYASFLYRYRGIIRNLLDKNGDPFFLKKWQNILYQNHLSRLEKEKYPEIMKKKTAKFLAEAEQNSCLQGILLDDENKILDTVVTIEHIIHSLCQQYRP